jgi:hydroxyacylglutathione hydrolase
LFLLTSGGNEKLVELSAGGIKEVYGGVGDDVKAVTKEVGDGDCITIGDISIRVMFTPCHTPGHVCYFAEHPEGGTPVVFTGDTLFVAGCGNFNKGTAQMMHDAFVKVAGVL